MANDPDYTKKLYELEQAKMHRQAKAHRETNVIIRRVVTAFAVLCVIFPLFVWLISR